MNLCKKIIFSAVVFLISCSTENIKKEPLKVKDTGKETCFIQFDVKGDVEEFEVRVNKISNDDFGKPDFIFTISSKKDIEAFLLDEGEYKFTLLYSRVMYYEILNLSKSFKVQKDKINYLGTMLISSNIERKTLEYFHFVDERVYQVAKDKFIKNYPGQQKDKVFLNSISGF